MAETTTTISNMALGRISVKTITDFDDATELSKAAKQSRLFYDQTRLALLESYDWPFATTRSSLTESQDSPPFEWDNKFDLPPDYQRFTQDWTVTDTNVEVDRWTIEGRFILTNENEVELKYVRNVTDPGEFSALFIEVLVLTMAIKMLFPMAGTSTLTLNMRRDLQEELNGLTAKAKQVAFESVNTTGRSNWTQARFGRGLPQ